MRNGALDALLSNESQQAIEALANALKRNSQLGESFNEIVTRRRDPRLTAVIIDLAIKESGKMGDIARQIAATTLKAEALEHLLTILEGSNHFDKAAAARLLGELKDNRATLPLVNVCSLDVAEVIRFEAVKALRKINDPSTVDLFLKAFEDGDAAMKGRLCEIFGEFNDARFVDVLIPLLEEENWYSRSKAALALGRIRSQRAIGPLIQMMQKYGPGNGSTSDAARSLRLITGQNFGESPDKWAQWWESNS